MNGFLVVFNLFSGRLNIFNATLKGKLLEHRTVLNYCLVASVFIDESTAFFQLYSKFVIFIKHNHTYDKNVL